MEHEKKVVVDLEKCMHPIKQKAYSTMCNMRKQDLIDYIRELPELSIWIQVSQPIGATAPG